MTKWAAAPGMVDVLERCERHPGEALKLVCGDHDQLCCPVCVAMDHRNMDLLTSTLEFMLNTISSEDELMNFAATWGIQEASTVRLRLLQIRNPEYGGTFVNEELDLILQHFGGASTSTDQQISSAMNADLDLAFDYVQEQDEVEGAVQAILFDDEIEEASHVCVEDGPWSPVTAVQCGAGDEPGPSNRSDHLHKAHHMNWIHLN
ncbi:uncharacterized protein LOC128218113 [Mya arenaria]|nr:uncharacterized protein LOC128218113 [Mya arenaria]